MRMIELVKKSQTELFKFLLWYFKSNIALKVDKQFILIKGNAPVLLVSHLDTVHTDNVKTICTSPDGNILMSPEGIGGDDRCGVYALIKTWNELKNEKGNVPWLLFTCDEEIGGHGASYFSSLKFTNLPKFKLLIEIDRKGSKDAVYYDCDNEKLEEYITSKGFKTETGSYTDVCDIGSALGVAFVNLSSGYYNAHTQHEYIVMSELEETIKKVKEIVIESNSPSFPYYEYIERVYKTNYKYWGDFYKSYQKGKEKGTGYGCHGGYNYDYDYDYDYDYGYGDDPDYDWEEDYTKEELAMVPKRFKRFTDVYLFLIEEGYYTAQEIQDYCDVKGEEGILDLWDYATEETQK